MEHSDEILDFQRERQDPEMYLASAGNRFANFLLDRIGVYLFMMIIFTITDSGFFYNGVLSNIATIFIIIAFLGYWVGFEYFFGKTPAKFITRTRVVTIDGKKPTFLTIVARTLCRFIPFEPFSFLDGEPIGWHDSITKTRVVSDVYQVEDEYL